MFLLRWEEVINVGQLLKINSEKQCKINQHDTIQSIDLNNYTWEMSEIDPKLVGLDWFGRNYEW